MGKIKTIAKKALKATPPGMMVTAGKKVVEEFKRLTKRKKPKYGKDLTTKQKEKILKQLEGYQPELL